MVHHLSIVLSVLEIMNENWNRELGKTFEQEKSNKEDRATKYETELDAEFEALPQQMKDLIAELGTEYGQEKAKEQELTIKEMLDKAPRSLKRKLQPGKKFGSQLLKRLRK
jgi:fructose/tagatose bisphosphate aldolase